VPQWSKRKADLETKLPPLTTERASALPNWHKIRNQAEQDSAATWTVRWDTVRKPGAFNSAQCKSESEARDCAVRFLRLGFLVYSIRNDAGDEVMDEHAIGALKPPPATRPRPREPWEG